jgi:hypothetical protein
MNKDVLETPEECANKIFEVSGTIRFRTGICLPARLSGKYRYLDSNCTPNSFVSNR